MTTCIARATKQRDSPHFIQQAPRRHAQKAPLSKSGSNNLYRVFTLKGLKKNEIQQLVDQVRLGGSGGSSLSGSSAPSGLRGNARRERRHFERVLDCVNEQTEGETVYDLLPAAVVVTCVYQYTVPQLLSTPKTLHAV